MSLNDWHKAGWFRPHQTSKRQIADLFAIVDRDPKYERRLVGRLRRLGLLNRDLGTERGSAEMVTPPTARPRKPRLPS